MMKRGFTIVELLVVIIVLGILMAITTTAYGAYKSRAVAAQASAITSAVQAASERYFSKNNEYPSAQVLFGGTPNGSVPSNYQVASSTLNVSTEVLDNSSMKFLPCAGTSCAFTDNKKVYYLTKPVASPTTQQQYVIGSCTFTFPTTDVGTSSYLMAYWNADKSTWVYKRSNNGGVKTSTGTTCQFS